LICLLTRQKLLATLMEMNLTDAQHGNLPSPMYMMGDLMIPDERIMKALYNSGLVENLRGFEINVLAELITVQYFEVKEFAVELYDHLLKEALMILVEGEIEVSAMVNNEPVSLNLETPGDLARIISFVGGDMMNVSARIKVRKDSAVLLLQRTKLESLLHSHPAIVYCVMRNLVRHVHGVARRKNAEKEQLSNYFYRMNGRY
jgi:CRP/FNR family cyclic AMP-dependent transcriptional regulator